MKKSTRKVDFFNLDKEFSDRVVNYMIKKVWRRELQLKYEQELNKLYEKLDRIKNLENSILKEEIYDKRKNILAKIGKLELQKQKDLKDSKFEEIETDKKFKKIVKTSQGANAVDAVREFYSYWGLDISHSYFEDELISAFGKKAFSIKTLVETCGKDSVTFNVTDAWGLLYTMAYARMVQVGTIKPIQIPEIIREKYTVNQKKNKKLK